MILASFVLFGLMAAAFSWGMLVGERLTIRRIKAQFRDGKVAMYISEESGAWKRVG